MTPKPTNTSMITKPIVTPSKWGNVRLKPKLAPEFINIRLLGPGVMEETSANNANADTNSRFIYSCSVDNDCAIIFCMARNFCAY